MTPPIHAPKASSARRRSMILAAMASDGRVEVSVLSSRFGVAEETIRRDLKALEQSGKLQRAHGGAIPAKIPLPQFPSGPSEGTPGLNIARFALRFLPDRGTIFIGPGPIGGTFATLLPNAHGLQVLTNSIPVALKASLHSNLAVYNLGGTVDPADGSQTGQWTREEALSLRLDVSFFVPRGLSNDTYLTAPTPQLASLLRTIIDASDRTIVLADDDSMTNRGLIKVAELSSLSDIIVDPVSAAQVKALLHGHETLVHIAEEEPEIKP